MNELVFKESDKVQVFVDDREFKSEVCRQLFELGALLYPKRLSVGDYVLSGRVAVERKSDADLESSIIDGRLFAQAKDLKENFESPLLAVIGKEFQRINPKALRGALISLAVDFKLPAFFFENSQEFAEFLYALGEKEQLKESRETRIRFGKKGFSLQEQQRFIVESLPGVGPKNARFLLENFKSVQDVFEADAEDLQDVEGIGKKKAEEIRRVLSSDYEN
ncbi:hypothetical protein COT57_00990 [Candidatus Micrarchaeota archaeon CG09_land_8_20_14_0_10_55_25]|nr:MAG: hypothetical protein COT57_00990 [Candidatus Micrarchaeota archaeon CG09_land_8_20_14_0_10_55_25]